MGGIYLSKCDNCSFSVETADNLLMSTSEFELDYYDDMYCLDCQKVVKVWQQKNGESIPESNQKCPKCKSPNIYIGLPENVKCPKCKKGNLTSDLIILTD